MSNVSQPHDNVGQGDSLPHESHRQLLSSCGSKSELGDNSLSGMLGSRKCLRDELREMEHYSGILPMIVSAAKNKGVRFDISNFEDGEIECLNDHVVIFRGSGVKFIDSLFERIK